MKDNRCFNKLLCTSTLLLPIDMSSVKYEILGLRNSAEITQK